MKSEERHDLELNTLDKYLRTIGEQLAPYASYIIYGGLALVAAWGIYSLSTSAVQTKDQVAWDAYTSAMLPGTYDSQKLQATANQYEGKSVGELAKLAWADGELTSGCNIYFSNKKLAMTRLDEALAAYESLASDSRNAMLRQRAQFGVAQTLEAKGEIEQAIKAYKKASGPYAELAETRVEYLQDYNAAEYAEWLASAVGASRPGGLGGGSRPEFMADPLSLPGDTGSGGIASPEEDFLELLRKAQEILPEQPEDGEAAESDNTGDDEATTDGLAAAESDTIDGDEPDTETAPEVSESEGETDSP